MIVSGTGPLVVAATSDLRRLESDDSGGGGGVRISFSLYMGIQVPVEVDN